MSKRALSTAAMIAGILVAPGFAAGTSQSVAAESDSAGYSRTSDDKYWRWMGQPGPVLSVEEIALRLWEQCYTEITKIELNHGAYEVKALDPEGVRVKLYVDSGTGEILRRKKDD